MLVFDTKLVKLYQSHVRNTRAIGDGIYYSCCTCRLAVNKRSALTALNGPMKLGSAPARLTDKGSHSLTMFMQAEKTQDSTKFSTNIS